MKEIFATLFQIHNETVNVWSHIIGYSLFLGMIVFVLVRYPNMYQNGYKGLKEYQ